MQNRHTSNVFKSVHTDSIISVFGYRCSRNDRPVIKRAGGVAIFYKNNFKCTVLYKSPFSNNCCEYLLCEISNKHSKILVGCVYKLPNCSSLDNFYEKLLLFEEKFVNIGIGGDFNLDLFSHSQVIYKSSRASDYFLCTRLIPRIFNLHHHS